MEAHHQQNNAPVMHQQHTVLEQRNPDVSIKNRSGGGGSTKSSKKRKRNQDLGPGAPRQPVNGTLDNIDFVEFAGFSLFLQAMYGSWTRGGSKSGRPILVLVSLI